MEFLEVSSGKEYALPGITFKALKMNHGRMPSLGFSLSYKRRRLAYGGDTGPCPSLWKLVQDAHIAVLEMTAVESDYLFHLNLGNILDIRKQLPPRVPLILTHLPALTKPQTKLLTGILMEALSRPQTKNAIIISGPYRIFFPFLFSFLPLSFQSL